MTKNKESKQVRLKLSSVEILIYSLIIPLMLVSLIVLILAATKVIKIDTHIAILILGMVFPVLLVILAILKFTNKKYKFKENYLLHIDAFITYKILYSQIQAIVEDKEKNRIYVKYENNKGENMSMWMRIDPKNITTVIGWFIEKCESLDIQEIEQGSKE